ncbi:cytochrome b [Teredinibacter haidensis]|uniref:cytochrome b n=1 Tax=Teredinibacter haidensis TaxID=2731755 RepID=UPI000949044B|nr:cytochrome b [Teredinibacter haidensis]
MSLNNTKERYGWLHVTIHWLSAITIIGLFLMGLWMSRLDYYDSWYQTAPAIHKSIGFVLVILTLFRLFWRSYGGVPGTLESHKNWEKLSSKLIHAFFYLAILIMFVSGYLITTAKGQALDVLGFISIPAIVSGIEGLEHLAEEVHEVTAFSIMWIAGLHALAAFKHHIFDKDRTLVRILGR